MSFQSNGGGALFTGQVSYAVVRNGNGQTFAPNTQAGLIIDTIEHLSNDFTATIGGTELFVTRSGIYVVAVDAWPFSTPLTSGRVVVTCNGNGLAGTPFTYRVPCDAVDSDIGEALDARVFIINDAGSGFICIGQQSDTIDQVLGGDIFAMRLGDLPS